MTIANYWSLNIIVSAIVAGRTSVEMDSSDSIF